jgi:hypothetical protein
MSLSKVWNENKHFRLVFTKMLVLMPKTGFINASLCIDVCCDADAMMKMSVSELGSLAATFPDLTQEERQLLADIRR